MGGGSGGRRQIQNLPGGRGAGGIGAVILALSRRASSAISATTSAAGRRTTCSDFLFGDGMTEVGMRDVYFDGEFAENFFDGERSNGARRPLVNGHEEESCLARLAALCP